MNTLTSHAPFDPRDLISERAARRVSAHPRTSREPQGRTALSLAGVRPAPAAETVQLDPPPSAGGSRVLRRWSVAELIAAASWRPAGAV